MRVLILGGDGYLGWPTAMHLTAKGHEVAVVDNYLRRRLSREEDVETLFEAPNLHERARLWNGKSGFKVEVFIGDLTLLGFHLRGFPKILPRRRYPLCRTTRRTLLHAQPACRHPHPAEQPAGHR